jgi:hypothetical protein
MKFFKKTVLGVCMLYEVILVKNPITKDFIDGRLILGGGRVACLVMYGDDKNYSMKFYTKDQKIKGQEAHCQETDVDESGLKSLFENISSGWAKEASKEEIECMKVSGTLSVFFEKERYYIENSFFRSNSSLDGDDVSFDGYESDCLDPDDLEPVKWKHTPS